MLRSVARSGLDADTPERSAPEAERREFVDSFADELGHRRPVDAVFLAATFGLVPKGPSDPTPETAVWLSANNVDESVPVAVGSGALMPEARGISIEAWTETELCALHALWRAARVRDDRALRDRALRAGAWHIEELDPENATHTPWAIHVFLVRWFELADANARLHAESLLHGCCVYTGRPDRRSALVLLDAADELKQLKIR